MRTTRKEMKEIWKNRSRKSGYDREEEQVSDKNLT